MNKTSVLDAQFDPTIRERPSKSVSFNVDHASPIRAKTTPFDSDQSSWDSANSSPATIGEYLLGGLLGRGNQGNVHKAIHTKTGKFVAVKEILIEDQHEEIIKKEVDILRQLNHPNILKYIDSYSRPRQFFIILEYIENGSLKDIVEKFGHFPESLVVIYVQQILSALKYLHEKNIIHRDIKGANILISKDGNCKLADFGLAANCLRKSTIGAPIGTPYWMAPELMAHMYDNVSGACDIWSLGATIIELITGHPPFHDISPIVTSFRLLEGDVEPIPEDIQISPLLRSFLEQCFQINPLDRATADQLLAHRWLAENNFDSKIHHSGSFNSLTNAVKSYRFTTEKIKSNRILKGQYLLNSGKADQQTQIKSNYSEKICQLQTFFRESKQLHINQTQFKTENFNDLVAQSQQLFELISQVNEDLRASQIDYELLVNNFNDTEEVLAQAQRNNQQLHDKIQLLEKNLIVSDIHFAKIIYGDDIPFEKFNDCRRGVLKVATKFTRFKKRYVALKDNFLFFYKPKEEQVPCDVMWLTDVNINTTVSDRFPNTFQLCTRKRSILICAAKENIMMNWMKELSFTKAWYCEDEIQPPQITLEVNENPLPPAFKSSKRRSRLF